MQDMYVAYSWLSVSLAGLAGFWLHLHYRRRDPSRAGFRPPSNQAGPYRGQSHPNRPAVSRA